MSYQEFTRQFTTPTATAMTANNTFEREEDEVIKVSDG